MAQYAFAILGGICLILIVLVVSWMQRRPKPTATDRSDQPSARDQAPKSTRERIRERLQLTLTEDGERAWEAFFGLPGISGWDPPELPISCLTIPFQIGQPMSLLLETESAGAHRRALGKALGTNVLPDVDLLSEIEGAALLTYWGLPVGFVKRGTTRTPDLEVLCPCGTPVSVEITRAKQQRSHLAVDKVLSTLIEVLRPGDFAWHLVCHLSDASDFDEDLNDIVDAALRLRPEQRDGRPGRWLLVAVAAERQDDVARCSPEFMPDWWPRGRVVEVVGGTLIKGQLSFSVQLNCLLPVVPVENTLRNKVDRPQCRGDQPYVIAIDTSEVPHGIRNTRSFVLQSLPDWPHVSGVLLFDSRYYIGLGRKQWGVLFIANKEADHPMPASLAGHATGEERDVTVHLAYRSIKFDSSAAIR